MDLRHIPLVDAHCHPYPPNRLEITARQLRDALSVSLHRESAAENESMLLVRMSLRMLAEILDCPRNWDAVIERRNERIRASKTHYLKLLWQDANISAMLIDPGYPGNPTIGSEEFSALVPAEVFEGYRIERFFPASSFHAPEYQSLSDLVDAFRAKLDDEARRPNVRFFKSVIAYRTGLAIQQVSESTALAAWKEHQAYRDPADKILRDYFFRIAAEKAAEHDLPFQLHTGHTSITNLWPNVNPILLTPFLNQPETQDTRFVLVHAGYPYCTEAGFMTSIYPNVMLDLSLMIPWSSIGISKRIEQILESAPTSKIMYGSDGIEAPEMYWISAKIGRRALGQVLDNLIAMDFVDADEALEIAEAILFRNAERCYGIALNN
jgi:uncharacterized protein